MRSIRALFDQLYWADKRLLATLEAAGHPPAAAIRLFDHILNAERVWLTRLEGRDSSHLPIWTSPDSLDGMRERIEALRAAFGRFLSALDDAALDAVLEYRNQSGVPFRNKVRDILLHVALHGQYHRGQINQLLRGAGLEPINVDYIMFAREP
ncbi:Putative uncharacterized protein [Thermobacillus xylanilyticus]|jgi:uncharacterized damage-inducible protein DinB|uniref:Damage-inducible protein DinB n=1 Tax=Thermobacillus xylanilyticus TaxID=76633 RepID=A0ABN7RWL3_THEXY|nr:DinB family protein [Thermobacillus xylanilyticus]CAG5087838.1 Putative uncharacterized protein [Thermobacillus xylanilyticus]